MSQITLQLPTPLTLTQITNQGALLVAAINNATTLQTTKSSVLSALQTQLTAAKSQVTTDLNGDPQVLARDVLTVDVINLKIAGQTKFYDEAIANSVKNQNLLSVNLARGFSIGEVICTVDSQGIITRTDTGNIVAGMKIVPPPLN